MIQITPHMRFLVAVEPVDFRNGIDGLAGICKSRLKADPMTGCVFIFRNKRATAIKILVYDGQGYWLCQKRLSGGRFRFWPTAASRPQQHFEPHQVQLLLQAGDPRAATAVPAPWRKLKTAD